MSIEESRRIVEGFLVQERNAEQLDLEVRYCEQEVVKAAEATVNKWLFRQNAATAYRNKELVEAVQALMAARDKYSKQL